MPRKNRTGGRPTKRPIERYEHSDKKRINNPPVGLVTPETDPVAPTHKTYDYITTVPSVKPRQELDYDPHLDPQLVWAGKKEHTSFEVHTASLHVHERIDPCTIIEAVRKRNGSGLPEQPSLFERREENPPLREAIDFYKHAHGWSNRLIAGDSLLVMNSLLEKEGLAGQVQMVYIDPPYGIKYGSNFQPFVNRRDVKDGRDEDLTQEPEMIRAFRDTWELGLHSYLTYLRDRLLLAKDLLHQSGSVFVQIGSGFRYKTVPHVTLKSIANNPEIREGMTRDQIDAAITRYADQETLYDQPVIDKARVRVTGPFTVEAVPAPTVRSLEDIEESSVRPVLAADNSIARTGSTLRHTEWRNELLKTGLRGKGGHHIDFSRVEPLAGTRWLHADAETKGKVPERVVISFGPEHSLLEQRQVELAWEEARTLSPRPAILVFAAFEFDPEAAKDIDELTQEKTGMTFLTAQMNADLFTEDLKKKRASNQSFWLVGRPDVELRKAKNGEKKGQWQAEVRGFDYYNTRSGTIESGDTSKIAMWLLDTDYDGRSLYPRQVFFPMADEDEGWARLARNLKAEIDLELIEAYRSTVSLPFELGKYKRIAVKVIDDRGIESLKVVGVK